MIRDTRNMTRKTKKRIFAIPAAAPAMPPKPNRAAMSAITRNVTAHPNIIFPPFMNAGVLAVTLIGGCIFQ
jgi:hypothetical protein